MEKEFNLVYYHRETKERVLCKRICKDSYIIFDEATKTRLPLSKWALDKAYVADKDNGKNQKRVRLNFERRKIYE